MRPYGSASGEALIERCHNAMNLTQMIEFLKIYNKSLKMEVSEDANQYSIISA